MTEAELIEKIAGSLSIPESEQKLFFEMLLRRCAEELNTDETLTVSGLGKFQLRKSFNENENDVIVFVTNDNEELHFNIPQKENENLPIDSYFSISIGKPVIPLKGSENEYFIPQSDNDIKRLLELKVEKFIEEATKIKTEAESQEALDINDIQFSFLNWKKSSNLNEEINQIEKGFVESSSPEVNEGEEHENEVEIKGSESLLEEEPEEIESDTQEVVSEETKENNLSENIDDVNVAEEIIANEELIAEKPEDEEELLEVTEEWVDDLIDENRNAEEEISVTKNKEEISSYPAEEEKNNVDDESSAISEAFKYAEDRKARIEGYRKRSYTGIFFAVVIILAMAAVIYFSYYSNEEAPVTLQNSEPKEFKVLIERSFEIPVSYPYQSGMFAGIYGAINKDILIPAANENQTSEKNPEIGSNNNSKIPEIRPALPSKRIKNYIYQYDDGTFAVQLSSWKSKTVALSETQKLLDKGYSAFIEETGLSGKTYYRVKVGGFKSLEEAEDFSKK